MEYMESQMQNHIDAGHQMMEEFSIWLAECEQRLINQHGLDKYKQYFMSGKTPEEAVALANDAT